MLNLPLSGIKKIEAIAQSSDEYISLSQGALKVGGIPQQIKDHLKSVLNSDKTDYYQSAWGIMELRKKLAQVLTQKHGVKIGADRIIVTHGAIGALSTLFFTLLDPGDEVLIPEPTYPAYEKLVGLARCKSVFVSCLSNDRSLSFDKLQPSLKLWPTSSMSGNSTQGKTKSIARPELVEGFEGQQAAPQGDCKENDMTRSRVGARDDKKADSTSHSTNSTGHSTNSICHPADSSCHPALDAGSIPYSKNHWHLDIEKIKAATTSKTKIIIFSNPWNPLGIVIPKETILELINWCEKNNIYLVIDEAYEDYCFDGSFHSSTPFVTKTNRLIKVASFSKNMAMSGWRVGYMVMPTELTEAMGKVQDAFLNCPNVPAQHAALYALDHPEFTQEFYNIIKGNIELVDTLLQPLVDKKIFTYQKPAGSFFLFLKTEFDDAQDFCMSILNHAKVSLVPGEYFGPSGGPFLRLCYARDTQILNEGIARLVKYFLE